MDTGIFFFLEIPYSSTFARDVSRSNPCYDRAYEAAAQSKGFQRDVEK